MANDSYVTLIDRVGRRYGRRPSEIIGITDKAVAFDFDAAITVRADRIERGDITDPATIQERQRAGFSAVKALQQRIKAARTQS